LEGINKVSKKSYAFYDKVDGLTKAMIDERYIVDHENKCFIHKRTHTAGGRGGKVIGTIPRHGSGQRELRIDGHRVTVRAMYIYYTTGSWPIDKLEL
jgi:hypothetical protein